MSEPSKSHSKQIFKTTEEYRDAVHALVTDGESIEALPSPEPGDQDQPAGKDSIEEPIETFSDNFEDKLAALAALAIQPPKAREATKTKPVATTEIRRPTVHKEITKRETFGRKISFPTDPTHMQAPPYATETANPLPQEDGKGTLLSEITNYPDDFIERMARCGLRTDKQLHALLKRELKDTAKASQYKKRILAGDLLIRNTLDFNLAGDFLMNYLEQQEERVEKTNAAALLEHQLRWEASCQSYATARAVDTITITRRRDREQFSGLIATGKYLCGAPISYPLTPLIFVSVQQTQPVKNEDAYVAANQPIAFNQTARPDTPVEAKAAAKKNGKKTKLPRLADNADFDPDDSDQQHPGRHRRERLSFDAPTGTNSSYKRDICEPDGFSEREQKEKPLNGPRGPSSEELLSREIRGQSIFTPAEEQKIFHEILDEQRGILSVALSIPEGFEALRNFYISDHVSSEYINRRGRRLLTDSNDDYHQDLDKKSLVMFKQNRELFEHSAVSTSVSCSPFDESTLANLMSAIMDLFPAHGFWKELRTQLGSLNQDGKITDKLAIWDAHARGIQAREETITKSNMKSVFYFVNSYHLGYSSLRVDLINEGNIGLLHAIRKFNPHLGYKFSTYAAWCIRRYVLSCANDTLHDVRLPNDVRKDLSQLDKVTLTLHKKLRRTPTVEETADELDMTVDGLRKLSSYRRTQLSFDADADGNNPDDKGHSPLLELFSTNGDSPEEQCIHQSTRAFVRKVLSTLPPREEKILRMRFGIDERHERQVKEISEEFSVTSGRISQILASALDKLRQEERGDVLKPLADFGKPHL